MFVYNVTIGIDPDIEKEWISWMKSHHIPKIMDTGLFSDYKFFRVLHDNEDGTLSFSIQYATSSIEKVQRYLDEFAPSLVEEHRNRFKDRHVAFRTLLQEV